MVQGASFYIETLAPCTIFWEATKMNE